MKASETPNFIATEGTELTETCFLLQQSFRTVFKTKRSAQKSVFDASRFDFEHNPETIGIVEAKSKSKTSVFSVNSVAII